MQKKRASEKVFIVLCRFSNTHPFDLRGLSFLKIFLFLLLLLKFRADFAKRFPRLAITLMKARDESSSMQFLNIV